MFGKLFKSFLLLLTPSLLYSQNSIIEYRTEMHGTATTNSVVPFWMRSNRYGETPLEGGSGGIILEAKKRFDQSHQRKFDWSGGLRVQSRFGNRTNLRFIEAYARGRASVFQLSIGRTTDVMGLNGDTSLSSGNFAISGNSLGIPKVEISIPEYYTLPFFSDLFSFKGSFSHGWLGLMDVNPTVGQQAAPGAPDNQELRKPNTFFHQKSFYVRLGKPKWDLRLYGGFSHNVQWGNERKVFGTNFKLSTLETLFYVATGKTYGDPGIPRSKIGNQLGSIDAALEYKFDKVRLLLYRQNFYDVGALSKLANIRDGLNGIAIENTSQSMLENNFVWKKVVLELFYSKHQAGERGAIQTNSGDEDYYNNYYYVKGWSYKSKTIGSPFITLKHDARANLPSKNQHFINNRVIAYHLGFSGKYKVVNILSKISFSQNFGTFLTGNDGINANLDGILFGKVNQFSFLVCGSTPIKNGIDVGWELALDRGKLLKNSAGLALKIGKSF